MLDLLRIWMELRAGWLLLFLLVRLSLHVHLLEEVIDYFVADFRRVILGWVHLRPLNLGTARLSRAAEGIAE